MSEENSDLIKCPNCGHMMSRSATGCPQCGHRVLSEGKRFLIFLAIVIVIFVFIAIVAWVDATGHF
jgi:DNA-directed RNA polymerase subunit RPC12/RpoP